MLSLTLFAIFEIPAAAAAVAGTAVSIPILIHLLNRRRFKIVEWAAMRFLLAAQRKNSRKMRIEQILLLAVRCLVLLLLVLAMCAVTPWAEAGWRWLNPQGGKGVLTGTTRTHKVIVVDGSYSMGLKAGESTCFEKARALAGKLVEQGGSGDAYSVVLMGSPPRRIVPEPSEDARRVAKEIRGLRPTHGNADLAGTLTTVAGLLRSSPGKFPAKEVYFLTDMQRSGWLAQRPADVAGAIAAFKQVNAKAIFVDVGQDDAGNLAVTSLELGAPVATTAGEVTIQATLLNYGDTKKDVPVKLSVGRAREKAGEEPMTLREVATAVVEAKRGQQTPVSFTYRFPKAGDYVVQVSAAHDGLEVDDARTALVRVRNTFPVLLVNGKQAPELFDQAAGWLRFALFPFDDGERVPASVTARPKVVTTAQFQAMNNLQDYDAVCLCDVARLSGPEAERLEAHVRNGGGVVIALGDQVDVGAYNERLFKDGKGLLPVELVKKTVAKPPLAFQLALGRDADRLDPLRLFAVDAARERLLQPLFSTFVETKPAKAVLGEMPRTVLNFTPYAPPGKPELMRAKLAGGPAVVEWRPPLPDSKADRDPAERVSSGRGRVVLVTTTLNSDWGGWPVSPAFPPLMQETLYHAASARLRERALAVSEPVELYRDAMVAGAEATVDVPRDAGEADDAPRRVPFSAAGTGSVMRFADTDLSGVYRVTVGSSPQEHLFAVNVPVTSEDQQASESDLARATEEDLRSTYPEWGVQAVRELADVVHAVPAGVESSEVYFAPQGPPIARVLLLVMLCLLLIEVILAWRFGHYSTTGSLPEDGPPIKGTAWQAAIWAAPWVLFAGLLGVGSVLLHDAATGDFLGFLPEVLRSGVERAMDVPPPTPGENSRWRLEYASYFYDGKADPWLAGTVLVIAAAGIGFVYWSEGNDISGRFRALILCLRVGMIVLLLGVFLPQLRLYFERQGWPDVVILLDDSASMGTLDVYRDPKVKDAAEGLAKRADLSDDEKAEIAKNLASVPGATPANRLRLAQTLLAKDDAYLRDLLTRRKVRLHVYRFASRPQRIADVTNAGEADAAAKAVRGMAAKAEHDSTQVGTAVRQVLNDFRGSSLAAVVVFSDGAVTEGEGLEQVAKYSDSLRVPLFFVGLGDAHEQKDLYLHNLQAVDSVYVNDRVVFDVTLTAQGFPGGTFPVALYEKGKDRPLDTKTVTAGGDARSVKVSLRHRPTEPGEKEYVIRTPVVEGEIDKENNQVEKTIYVRETKQINVLYVEGYRRYEFHYLKTLLERESNRVKGNKTVNLRVLLMDADGDAHEQDRTLIQQFPTPFRMAEPHTAKEDLWSYDVVILGDVDPERMTDSLKNLAEWVQERGGGLLVLGGERFSPRAYRNSPLKDILPLDVASDIDDGDEERVDAFRMELTPAGRMHPIFQFNSSDEKEKEEIWGRLKEFYWHAEGYQPKRAAEVLATHPTAKVGKKAEKLPLILQHFAGAGRCMFLGVSETWRWNWREDQLHYNQFWVQTVRYLARSKIGRIELRLDRQTPYRRGEPIKMTVRFPDDEKPPPDGTKVTVLVERSPPGKPGEKASVPVQLTRLEGSRATFEATLTQTPEGDYRFWLSEPAVKPRPQAQCKVLAPPGEMEYLRMNEEEMKKAAEISKGRFYTLDGVDRLIDELPAGERISVNAAGPPVVVWNSWLLFALALGLFTSEWLLRKQKNLL
ncbi:MAG: VWA domain-containing protein [Gemmataceae bacterium]